MLKVFVGLVAVACHTRACSSFCTIVNFQISFCSMKDTLLWKIKREIGIGMGYVMRYVTHHAFCQNQNRFDESRMDDNEFFRSNLFTRNTKVAVIAIVKCAPEKNSTGGTQICIGVGGMSTYNGGGDGAVHLVTRLWKELGSWRNVSENIRLEKPTDLGTYLITLLR